MIHRYAPPQHTEHLHPSNGSQRGSLVARGRQLACRLRLVLRQGAAAAALVRADGPMVGLVVVRSHLALWAAGSSWTWRQLGRKGLQDTKFYSILFSDALQGGRVVCGRDQTGPREQRVSHGYG